MRVGAPEALDFVNAIYGISVDWRGELVSAIEARGWGVNDSDFGSYCAGLMLADGREGVQEIVSEHLRSMDGHRVGLDIAGGTNGVALQSLLRLRILEHGIVTNYADRRSDETRKMPNLTHVEGDLAERATWETILEEKRACAPEGLSVVLFRPVGPLQDCSPEAYKGAAHFLLDITRPGGVHFWQIPRELKPYTPIRERRKLEVYSSLRCRDDIEEIIPAYIPVRPEDDRLPDSAANRLLDSVIIVKK